MDNRVNIDYAPQPLTLEQVAQAEDRAYDEMTAIAQMMHKRSSSRALVRLHNEARIAYLAASALREKMEREQNGN